MSLQILQDKTLQSKILKNSVYLVHKKVNKDMKGILDLDDKLTSICNDSVYEVLPVPYGVYINIAAEICSRQTFKSRSVNVAAVFVSVCCSSAKHIDEDQFLRIQNTMKTYSGTEEHIFHKEVYKALSKINKDINISSGIDWGYEL